MHEHDGPARVTRRLAAAPISWGVCEVPGWGRMLPPERVFAEMAALDIRATELGPVGWLPEEPSALRTVLDRHGLRLVGGFVPLVLHEPSLDDTRAEADRIARLFAAAGAEVFVAAVVTDAAWSAPVELDDAQWERLVAHLAEIDALVAGHGLRLALHPHAGTLVERAGAVDRLLETSDVGWCLDTGHLLIGGVDPVEFVRAHGDRVVHVHLKDVDGRVAARVRSGELTLMQGTQAGMFRPLGHGDARIDEVIRLLDDSGYDRWLVLEQDTAITGQEPPVGRGPVLDVKASIDHLANLAPARGERVTS
jgi:inosose dehydratase